MSESIERQSPPPSLEILAANAALIDGQEDASLADRVATREHERLLHKTEEINEKLAGLIGEHQRVQTKGVFTEDLELGGYRWMDEPDFKYVINIAGIFEGLVVLDTTEVNNPLRKPDYGKYEVCVVLEPGDEAEREFVPLTAMTRSFY